jgi:hypothetical protein
MSEEAFENMHLPPANFDFLVLSLRAQVEVQLGLLHFGPPEEKPEPDLDLARHGIDLLAVLKEKTRGNLSLEEQRLLENSLTELRFRYVQVGGEQRAKQAKPAATEDQKQVTEEAAPESQSTESQTK